PYSQSVFRQLAHCRTANTGVHLLRCDDADCGHQHYQYHNCGNRHCPNCGGMKRQQWLEDKIADLLPTTYYHVVFTLPHELNSLIMGNRKELFSLLFESASYTLLKLAKDKKWLGATPGIISILHTWGQTLNFHPHVHCIVSGGGVKEDKDGGIRWVKEKRRSGNYLFPGTAMQQIYKAYFLKRLRKMVARNKVKVTNKPATEYLLHEIGFKRWNVYAKRPFGGPGQVMEYLGRYTHKIAITAHRILEIDEAAQTIRFAYKDYRKRGTKEIHKEMTLSIQEFIRRFEQHILPKGFVKIRHYGYLRPHNQSKRDFKTSVKYPANSRFFKAPDEINRSFNNTDQNISISMFKTASFFLEILFDPYRQVFYRIALIGNPSQKKISLEKDAITIIILNKNFKIIGET